ncbi:MAG: hypothetical protein IPP97_26525 [Candidatus Obscuribacter sp.]|nr:hypothetical protein [Candidatus Obscuribacter sp.]MBP6348457.1 hypothetical protein [Candidatus Obscuribacter sp.]MBP6592386.1 hypothetical protein [Candidatus Obscuribacter sp.]MBP7575262.1 hypothetical protein [Candidatus Obscuribacter sp.]
MIKSGKVFLVMLPLLAMFCLYGCGRQITASNDAPVSTEPEPQPGRFAFVYDPGADAVRKQALLAKIDRFWQEFRANSDKMTWSKDPKADRSFIHEFLTERLHSFDHRLEWECGGKDGISELDFSVAQHIDLLPLLSTLVERSGEIPGWRIGAFRQRIDSNLVDTSFEARTQRTMPPYKAVVTCNKQNEVTVEMRSSKFGGNDLDADVSDACLIAEIVLGEENFDKWVCRVTTSMDKSVDSKSFNSTQEAAKFAKAFDNIKHSIFLSLPNKPRWQIEYEDRVSLLTLPEKALKAAKKKERFRYTFVSLEDKLAMRLIHPYQFWSEQFSKFGEKFVYLHVISQPGDEMDKRRPELERSLFKILKERKLGCVLATGRGKPESFYFDLCVTDVDKAVPVLKQFCIDKKLPPTTWLRFYDECWRNEWVKMLPDTPDLKNPREYF